MSAIEARDIAQKVLDLMGIASIVSIESDEPIQLTIDSSDSALLIGKGGETLRALQAVINSAYRRSDRDMGYVGIDIAGYKKERIEKVQAIAQELADKALATGEPQHLSPMNSFERRSVHTLLANEPDIITESEGDGMSRHIVIRKR